MFFSNQIESIEEISAEFGERTSSTCVQKTAPDRRSNHTNTRTNPQNHVHSPCKYTKQFIIKPIKHHWTFYIISKQLPPSGKKNFKRKLVDRYKRSLFSNKRSAIQIKSELMKLIKNSNELIDIEMIGLKNFQYYLNSSGCNSSLSSRPPPPPPSKSGQVSAAAAAAVDSFGIDLEMIINQNGITYEQLQTIIEELLNENNYHIEHLIHLK